MTRSRQSIPLPSTLNATESGDSLERLVNWYADPTPGANQPFVLRGTPGGTAWAALGTGAIRGMHKAGAYLYAVRGTTLFKISTDATFVEVGTVAGAGRVRFVDDGAQGNIMIATSGLAYWSDGSAVYGLPINNFAGIAYQDGYALLAQQGTQNLYVSNLDDFSTIDPLDFTTADAHPDLCVTVASDQREAWVFKEETIEIFQNVGGAGFPFQRAQFIERGCGAGDTVVQEDSTLFWVGDDFRVYRAVGYQPQRISIPYVERVIEADSARASSHAYTYKQGGRKFYALHLTSRTMVFDVEAGTWHERKSQDLANWRYTQAIEFADKVLGSDYANGTIYELSLDTFADDGDPIVAEIYFAPLGGGLSPVFMSDLLLDLDQGVGIDGSGQGDDPVAMLVYSDNDGKTFSQERHAKIGKLGVYGQETLFNRLGRFKRRRSLRVSISDPVRRVLRGAYAAIDGGT